MQTSPARASPRQRVFMILGALFIGTSIIVVVAIAAGSTEYLLSAFAEESGPLLSNVLIASAPFLLLAVRGITERLPWLVGLILTLLVWGYVIFELLTGGFEGGTSVGNAMWLAMVMIGSSVVIMITCHIISRRTSQRSPRHD